MMLVYEQKECRCLFIVITASTVTDFLIIKLELTRITCCFVVAQIVSWSAEPFLPIVLFECLPVLSTDPDIF